MSRVKNCYKLWHICAWRQWYNLSASLCTNIEECLCTVSGKGEKDRTVCKTKSLEGCVSNYWLVIPGNWKGQLSNFFFLILFIFRGGGRKGEREGQKHQCMVASHMPPTGDLACNPGICPNWELNLWPFDSQAHTQSTEPHQPGLPIFYTFELFDFTQTYIFLKICDCIAFFCIHYVLKN